MAISMYWALPYDQDPLAQEAVGQNPDGMTLEEVGAVYGLSRQRIEQIEHEAMAKIRELFCVRIPVGSVRIPGQGWRMSKSY